MNNYYRRFKKSVRALTAGQSLVEMAAVLPVLAILLVVATDFGRLYYTNIEVIDAARAGAQYGSQSVTTAVDANGMQTAAKNDAVNVPGLTATAKQCTCASGSSVTACPTSYCTSSPAGSTFVEVDTSTTFNTIVSYPGVPSSVALSGKAVMMVAN